MSNSNYNRKIIEIIDIIALVTYAFAIGISFMKTARFPIVWTYSWYRLQEIAIIIWIILAVWKVYLFFDKRSWNTWLAIALLAGAAIGKYSGLGDYLYLIAPMIMLFNVPFQRIARLYTAIMGSIFVITIACVFTKIVPDIYTIVPRREHNVHYLGFSSHNASMAYWLFISMAFLICTRNPVPRIVGTIIVTIITLYLFRMTDSLTSTLLSFGVCAFFLCNSIFSILNIQIGKQFKRIIEIFMIGMPLYAIIITSIGVLYDSYYAPPMNTLLARYRLLYRALVACGIKFPNIATTREEMWAADQFSWLTGTKGMVSGGDILYGTIFVRHGLVVLILFLCLQGYFLYLAYKRKAYDIFICEVVVVVFCCLESCLLDIAFSLFLLVPFTKWEGEQSQSEISVSRKTVLSRVRDRILEPRIQVNVIVTAITVIVYVIVTSFTFAQMKVDRYDAFGEQLQFTGIEKVKLHNDAYRQYFTVDQLVGIRLYLTNEADNQDGSVFVTIGDAENDKILMQKEIDVRTIPKDMDLEHQYIDVVSEPLGLDSATQYYFDISVSYALGGKICAMGTRNTNDNVRLIFKPLQKSVPNLFMVWILYSAWMVYVLWELVRILITDENIEVVDKPTAQRAKRTILPLLLVIMFMGTGWLNADSFLYNSRNEILRSTEEQTVRLGEHATYTQKLDLQNGELKEIHLLLESDSTNTPTFTIAIENEYQDMVKLASDKDMIFVSTNEMMWDVSDIDWNQDSEHDLYIFTGFLEKNERLIIDEISVVYGKSGISILKCVVLGVACIVTFFLLYNTPILLKRFIRLRKQSRKYFCLYGEAILQICAISLATNLAYCLSINDWRKKGICFAIVVVAAVFDLVMMWLAHMRRMLLPIITGAKCVVVLVCSVWGALYFKCFGSIQDNVLGILIASFIEVLIYLYSCEYYAMLRRRAKKKYKGRT